MRQSKMNKHKFDTKHLFVYNQFKSNHETEGFTLEYIDTVYLPFWICKQEIYVQKELKVDEFSEILLELVKQGIKKHSEICSFLGVKEDDFCLSQLDYLLNYGFLEEGNDRVYEITYDGQNFLKGENLSDKDTIESAKIEYSISDLDFITEEKFQNFYSDLTKEYFDKNITLDKKTYHNFSGYKLIETHKLKRDDKYLKEQHIPHNNTPTFNRIKESNFIEFYNNTNADIFYDFGKPKIETHKRSIEFYLLFFKGEQSEKIEIRHCKNSVLKFDAKRLSLESNLSKHVQSFIRQDSAFIENLMNIHS